MWQEYENNKRLIQELNLSPEEYEKRIQEILKDIENASEDKIFS